MSLSTTHQPARFHYAWVVAAVTFLTLIVAAGVRSVPGVLIVPLEHEFGWTRATISFAVSVNLLLYGLDWIATVPPTVALTAQAFGREKVGIMFGWIIASHQVGAALAAWGAGLIRTNEGAYDHAFLISGTLCVFTAAGVLLIGRGRESAHISSLQSGAATASAPN